MNTQTNNEIKREGLTGVKRTVARIAVILVAVLLICTVVSQQIYRQLLPTVELAKVIMDKPLENRTEANGRLTYTGLVPIRAKGAWRVTETLVNVGDSVSEGNELLKFDTADTSIAEERLRLEVSALEAQLSSNSPGTDKESLKMQLEAAKAELEYHMRDYPEDGLIRAEENGKLSPLWYTGRDVYKGDYIYTLNGKKYYARARWVILEYIAESGSHVMKGDPLFRIDVEDANLEKVELEVNIKQLEYSIRTGDTSGLDREQLNAKIELAKRELEQYMEKYPSDGAYRADSAGTITEWVVGAGDVVSEDQILGYMTSGASELCAEWTLSREAGAAVTERTGVVAEIYGKNTSRVTTRVYRQVWDSENGSWRLAVRLTGYKLETPIESTRVKIIMSEPSDKFPFVVPVSCLQKDMSGGSETYYLYIIEEREGLFSTEMVVIRMNIEGCQKDSLNAGFIAMDIPDTEYVVRYSSQPLYDGCVVKVVG